MEYKPFGIEPDIKPTPAAAADPPQSNTFQKILSWVPFYKNNSTVTNKVGEDLTSSPNSFSWFKWYYILPGIFVVCYVIMLAESVAESRRSRNANKLKPTRGTHSDEKEGLCGMDGRPPGILKHKTPEERTNEYKKKVAFYKDNLNVGEWLSLRRCKTELSEMGTNVFRYICSTVWIFYEWWIFPWIYTFTRII